MAGKRSRSQRTQHQPTAAMGTLPVGSALANGPIASTVAASAVVAGVAASSSAMSCAGGMATLVGNGRAGRSADELATLTKQQLQTECRRRGQKTTGTKVELLQRLGHKMATKRNATTTLPTSATASATTAGGGISPANGTPKEKHHEGALTKAQRQREREEREAITLWRHPITTIEYFTKETLLLLYTYGRRTLQYKKLVLLLLSVIIGSVLLLRTAGPHQQIVTQAYAKVIWCCYWIGLGILSSVGLGTGLHTFLLYLGPHIAKVTLAAYECGSLDFPEPPYPDEIICPEQAAGVAVTIFSIMSKVRLEAMCWGAGTALGELPPYFMARAARFSGIDPDDEDAGADLAEFEELQRKRREDLTLIERGKLFVEHVVQRVGFFGILACASIPNPLFDLAGITCGHFLVPFWTFFGATLIGKAIIKMHIQKLFVIIAFNETLIETALAWLTAVPVVGAMLQTPFKSFLDDQKSKLHAGGGGGRAVEHKGSLLAAIFEKFVVAMILYFVVSIVNSLAQNYHKRIAKRRGSKSNKD